MLLGSVGASPARPEAAIRALAAAIVLVCLASLVNRLAPRPRHRAADRGGRRLSYRLSHWNALGVFTVVGLVLCLHLTYGWHQPRLVRAIAAAATPPLAATLHRGRRRLD